MAFDQFHKLLTKLAGLAGTHALNLLQLFERDRIDRGHLLQ